MSAGLPPDLDAALRAMCLDLGPHALWSEVQVVGAGKGHVGGGRGATGSRRGASRHCGGRVCVSWKALSLRAIGQRGTGAEGSGATGNRRQGALDGFCACHMRGEGVGAVLRHVGAFWHLGNALGRPFAVLEQPLPESTLHSMHSLKACGLWSLNDP